MALVDYSYHKEEKIRHVVQKKSFAKDSCKGRSFLAILNSALYTFVHAEEMVAHETL